MKIFNLTDIQYNVFISKIREYLSNAISKTDVGYGNSTVFGQIINVLAAAFQNIMLYIEDAFTEQNKYTAQRKKSIYALASQSGYSPFLGAAASVQLGVTFIPNNQDNLNVIINNHEELTCTQNGLQYCIVLPQESILLSPDKNNNMKQFAAIQGTFHTENITAVGGKYYTCNIKYNGNTDMNYLEVYVNNIKYEYKESLYDMSPDGEQFTWKVSLSSGFDLIFGNDIHGRALKDGDVITVKYLTHDGESGNIDVNSDTYFVFNNPLKNIAGEEIDGNSIFNVSFATTDSISSGSDSETTDSVRQMIGLNSRSLCLASPQNYKLLLSRFSFCGYNRTWSEPGSLIVNSLILKNYTLQLKDGKDYFNLNDNDFLLSPIQKQSIKNSIKNSNDQLAGVTYNIIDPDICKYACYMYIKLKSDKYDREFIRLQIKNVVGKFFSDINSDSFIPKSDIIYNIKNSIPEIDSVDIYFLSEKNETALQTRKYYNKVYKYNPAKGSYDIKTETVYLYDGENPNLGLDNHGNIQLNGYDQFPVLMGGWDFLNSQGQEVKIIRDEPLIITFI